MNKKMEIEITAHAKEVLRTTNGIVPEDNLRFAKENLLFSSLRVYSYLVEDKKSYPQDDKTNVDLDLDIIILSRARYNEMKEHENRYLEICN